VGSFTERGLVKWFFQERMRRRERGVRRVLLSIRHRGLFFDVSA
jgi:uncharacterized caspase-like protein